MGKLQDLLYNPTGIYKTSKIFFETGIVAAKHHFAEESITQGKNINTISLVAAPAANISFSLELALKGIHFLHSKEIPKIHSLVQLFNSLPEKIKLSIQKRPQRKQYSHFFIIDIGEDSDRTFEKKLSFISGSMEEILNNLKLHDNSFVDFRYMFEIGNKIKPVYFNYLFMMNITHNTLDTLHDLIKRILIVE